MGIYNHSHSSPKPLQGVDLITIALYLTMVAAGWFTIYAAGFDPEQTIREITISGRSQSQLIWMGASFAAGLALLLMDRRLLRASAPFLYALTLLILVATIFIAPNIKGSHSWLVITETVRIQPAEFAKVTTAMMLAWWTSRYEFDISKPRELIVALAIFLLPILIIILQSETGSALVFLAFVLVLYREGLTSAVPFYGILLVTLFVLTLRYNGVLWGATNASLLLISITIYIAVAITTIGYCKLPYRWWLPTLAPLPVAMVLAFVISLFRAVDYSIWALIALGAVLIITLVQSFQHRGKHLWLAALVALLSLGLTSGVDYFFDHILQPHQQTRILVSLGMKDDPSGAGYNVRQSLIAIGSGGATGKGYLQGTQTKLSFVPEQDTDFIFCTLAEELGFIGSLLLMALFTALLLRLIYISERQVDPYVRTYGYSVAAIIFFHLTINIGMVIGLVPVIGIPLPFFSYGGSSLLSFTILLFILLRLDQRRQA